MHGAISDDELGDLLTDPACPSAILFGTRDNAAIGVEAAVAFVQRRHPNAVDVEGQIDRFVMSVGGRKDETVHLNDLGRRLFRGLLRRPGPGRVVLYVVPGQVFAERGRRPKNASLPQSSI